MGSLCRSGIFIWLLVVQMAFSFGLPVSASGASGQDLARDKAANEVDPRTWPEIPVPPQIPESSRSQLEENYPELNQRWLMQVGAGWQHNVSPQKKFFTDMVQLNLVVGKPISEHLLPIFSCELGFGGLQESLEQMTSEGRSTVLGFTLGMLGSIDFSERHRGYLSLGGGYFTRSMLWGERYRDPETDETSGGDTITMGDWGLSLRTGFLFQLSHGTKARFVDLGVGLQISPADKLEFQDDENILVGSNDDAWLTITLRFWDTL